MYARLRLYCNRDKKLNLVFSQSSGGNGQDTSFGQHFLYTFYMLNTVLGMEGKGAYVYMFSDLLVVHDLIQERRGHVVIVTYQETDQFHKEAVHLGS